MATFDFSDGAWWWLYTKSPMKYPMAAPAKASDALCLRPPNRATLTAVAALYATQGTHLLSEYSRAATRASAQVLIEWPDGNASPPVKNFTDSPLVSGRGLWLTAFNMLTVISASISASMPIRPVSRARG